MHTSKLRFNFRYAVNDGGAGCRSRGRKLKPCETHGRQLPGERKKKNLSPLNAVFTHVGLKFDLPAIVLPAPLVASNVYRVSRVCNRGWGEKKKKKTRQRERTATEEERERLDIFLVVFERRIQLRYSFPSSVNTVFPLDDDSCSSSSSVLRVCTWTMSNHLTILCNEKEVWID